MKQRIIGSILLTLFATVAVLIDAESRATANSFRARTAAAEDGPEVVEDSMHEFMEYVFQPTYKRLKVTMAKKPEAKAGWKAMKSDALILAESCNLLFARTPDENASDWNKHAVGSRVHGAELYQAARKQEFEAATTSYKAMLESCNACHRQFEDGRHILQP